MLDLVKDETERIDSRFLEPACGSGNFLVQILRRKLAAVELKYGKSDFERRQYALLGLMCIYGIELLPDNIAECRANVLEILADYLNLDESDELYRAASYVLSQNLVHGDALTMRTHDGQPITFAEWGYLGKGKFQRRDFRLRRLTQSSAFSAGGFAFRRPRQARDFHAGEDVPADDGERAGRRHARRRSEGGCMKSIPPPRVVMQSLTAGPTCKTSLQVRGFCTVFESERLVPPAQGEAPSARAGLFEPERLVPSALSEPEGPILSAQAEGLGLRQDGHDSTLKGSFIAVATANSRTALSGPMPTTGPRFPGLRPGLTESAFQAEIQLPEESMPQSLAKVYLHVVFSTKNRAPLLADEWRDELFRVLGRRRQQSRLPILDRGRSRGPHPLVDPTGANHQRCRRRGENQIVIVRVDQPDAWPRDAFSLAGGVCRVLGKPIECRGRTRVHSQPARTSRQAIVPGRTARMVTAVRNRMGRTLRLGLKAAFEPERLVPPTQGEGLTELALQAELIAASPCIRARKARSTSPPAFEPERLVLPAQAEGLGSRSCEIRP